MSKYQEFLNKLGVLSEIEFYELLNTLEDFDVDYLETDGIDLNDKESFISNIIQSVVNKYTKYAWIDSFNYENKTISIYDISNLDELEKLKKVLSQWKITNYEETKQIIEGEEKDTIYNFIKSKLSLEELKNIAKKYVN